MNMRDKIEKILDKVDIEVSKFPAMTYEQGIEEVLLYLLGDISDDEFEYSVSDIED